MGRQKMNVRDYQSTPKCLVGPGGMKCPCCTKLPPERLKVMIRRIKRRTDKMKINKDMED